MRRRPRPDGIKDALLITLALTVAVSIWCLIAPCLYGFIGVEYIRNKFRIRRLRKKFLLLLCPHCGCPSWRMPCRIPIYLDSKLTQPFTSSRVTHRWFLGWTCTSCHKEVRIKEVW